MKRGEKMDKGKIVVIMAVLMVVSLIFVIWGTQMHAEVTKEETKFHDLQAEYWNLAKSTRDSAATGSELNKQLIRIQQYPSELSRLKLVGVGRMLTGIYILLLVILIALVTIPTKLAMIIGKKKR